MATLGIDAATLLQSPNTYYRAVGYGLATATVKSDLLRDLLLQVDTNTKELQALTTAADTWTLADWTASFTQSGGPLARSAFLDQYDIPHPVDTAKFGATGVVAYPSGGLASFSGTTISYPPTVISKSSAQIQLEAASSTTPFYQALNALSPAGTLLQLTDGLFFVSGQSVYKVVDPTTLTTYLQRAPTQSELDAMIEGMEEAAQGKTQIAQSMHAYMQQLVADKSNAELLSTGVLQRLDSLMRDIISKIG
jgi:hypothetical protein